MNKKLIFLMLLLVLGLSACAKGGTIVQEKYSDTRWVNVYYAAAQAGDKTPVIMSEPCEIPKDGIEQTVYAIFSQMCNQPISNSIKSPIPHNTILEKIFVKDDCVTLYLSHEYASIGGFSKTVSDYCLTMSMCELEGINEVEIAVENEIRKLTCDDIVLSHLGDTGYGKKLRLYFPGKNYQELEFELRDVLIDGTKEEAYLVVEQLSEGSAKGTANDAIPGKTVINSVTTKNGVCTVDLSQGFINSQLRSEAMEKMCIAAIAKSLFNIKGINKIQILIDGVKTKGFTYVDLSKPILPDTYD